MYDAFILNPNMESELIEDYLYVVDNKNNKVHIFNEFEKNLICLFDTGASVKEQSEVLSKIYVNYNEQQFRDFIIALYEKEILLPL